MNPMSPMLPAPAPMAAGPTEPVAVVGPQYCAPYVVPLTVTKKSISLTDGDFTVTDANDTVVLKVKGTLFSVRHRRVLLDAAGQPLLSMQEKILSMHNRWEVYRGDSAHSCDKLFTVKKSSMLQMMKTEMDIFLAGNTSEHVCDFKIKGSYFDRSSAFYLGNSNTIIAQMNRKHTAASVVLGRDVFSITVFPQVDYVFIAALVAILDDVALTVTRRSAYAADGGFAVTDAAGAVVLLSEVQLLTRFTRRAIVDAAGVPIVSMKRKLFSTRYTWEVFRGDSEHESDLLFTVKRSTYYPKPKLDVDVFLASNTSQNACDFRVSCSYFRRSCTLYIGGSNNVIAQMNRCNGVSDFVFLGSKYSVTVLPHVDYVFVMVIAMIIDEIAREIRLRIVTLYSST
uniref:Protein LURP-one-related 15 n=1 Tax=Oryza punctata TaxID=4537 RepID=A0A0E0LIP2_ORYPU